jgi:predicted nucleic acid-binding protein
VRIGVDSSILIAAMHANHPMHAVAVGWLTPALRKHDLVVADHTVLECYAVMTRLPGTWRVTGDEANHLIRSTVMSNMEIFGFAPKTLSDCLEKMAANHVVGGKTYDAFIVETLKQAGTAKIATFNPSHFSAVAGKIAVFDPSKPE